MTLYENILANTLGTFEAKTGCIVPDDSDTAIRFQVFTDEMVKMIERIDFCIAQMFPNTAQGIYLERHGAVRGIYKKAASKSSGNVVFRCKTAAPSAILIPKGTLCTSSKNTEIMFESTKEITLAKNTTAVMVPVQSTVVGAQTNVASKYIDLLVTAIPGISSVENTEKTAGGSDNEPDDMFRERVLEAFNRISNGANLTYYEQFAKTKPDVWHAKASFTPNKSNEVELFVENHAHTLNAGIVSDLQSEIEDKRALGMKITVKRPTEKLIDLAITVKVDNVINEAYFNSAVFDEIEKEMSLLKIGQRFSPAKLAKAILQLEGICDVSITSPTLPVPVLYNQIAEPGSVQIIIQEEVKL